MTPTPRKRRWLHHDGWGISLVGVWTQGVWMRCLHIVADFDGLRRFWLHGLLSAT